LVSGCSVYYVIQDSTAWECGLGTYTAGSPDTLARTTVESSSAGGTTKISLDGAAQVAITLTAIAHTTAAINAGTIDNAVIGGTTPSTGTFTTISASTVSGTGFSTYLASPPAIGGTTPAAGSFTTLSASSTISGSAFSSYLASPPSIGSSTAGSGAFTTLSASSSVSGAGFTNYLASPPAIGGTAANTGAFTTLSASTSVSGTGFSNYLASPPSIGAFTPNSATFTALNANTSFGVGTSTLAATANFFFNAASGQYKQFDFQNAGSTRWTIGCDISTESGSNAGSNFYISSWADNGSSFITTAMTITRSSGLIQIQNGLIGTPIGASTPSTGAFTTLSATSGLNSTAVGNTTASTGAFTTLSASSSVSGTGFSNYLASPPAIGGTAAANGTFTTLAATTASTAPTVALTDSSTNVATTAYVNGICSSSVTVSISATGTTTISAVNACYSLIIGTGTITANVTVIMPAPANKFIFENLTTGAYTLTVTTSSATNGGIVVASGQTASLTTDGTNVLRANSDNINNTPIGLTTPSTGAFTTLSATSGLNSTAVGNTTASTGAFTTLSATSGLNSTAVGNTTASTGAFTTLSATSGLNNTAVGNTTASTGAFTTLSASSSVSGTGFTNYFASPPALGGTAPNSGAFTSINFGTLAGQLINVYSTTYGFGINPSEFTMFTGGNFTFRSGFATSNSVYAQITSTGINSTAIGATSPSTGAFTTLAASASATAPTVALSDSSYNVATTSFVTQIDGGLTSVSVAGSSNVTLTALQAAYAIIQLTGALTGNINVIVPTATNKYIIENATTGAYTITVKTSAGTGVNIGQGYNLGLFCDGTNVIRSGNDFSAVAITGGSINNTTIGASTASTGAFTTLSATSGLNSTAVGNTTASTGAFTTLSASSTATAPTVALSDSSTNIATTAFVSGLTDGMLTLSVAGSSNVALTALQAANAILQFTGALTGNITVSTPASTTGQWIVYNNTTGAYTLTFITASGTGVLITQGGKDLCFSTGTATLYGNGGTSSVSLQWTGGAVVNNGTYYFTIYAPFAGTIASMDYFTAASTSFVVAINIAGTAVTGLSAVTVNSATQANTAATALNTFAAGQIITAVITSSTSSPTSAMLNLRLTRG
jgi:hypothetical protein